MNSRYYSPEFGRFISADVFISTGQGLQGANMFAYCGNNPVMGYDPSGEFFFTILGAVTGFIGSAATSLLLGNDITDAIDDGLAGAIGGGIAGLGVDAGLLLIGTGGAAAPFLAAGLAFGFGGAGGVATTAIASKGNASREEYRASFIVGGVYNMFSLATGWNCAGKTPKSIAIKAAMNTEESVIVGTAIATTTSIATYIGIKKATGYSTNDSKTIRRIAK